MKKEVVKVSDGKEFVKDIEKILGQTKGNYVYLDDEIVSYLNEIVDIDLDDYFLIDEYEISVGQNCNGFNQLLWARKFIGEDIYDSPNSEDNQKQILIIVA